MSEPIYAIADIHGHLEELDRALALIEADGGAGAQIVFLGDLVDRGPESRGVLDRLIEGRAAGRRWTVLKGNHDDMFENFVGKGVEHDPHIASRLSYFDDRLGGKATLASYGVTGADDRAVEEIRVEAAAAVPPAHRAFLADLPLYLEREELLFVHAGIRPGVPLARQAEGDLIWIRDGFLEDTTRHPWLVIHGHTALKHPAHFGNRVDLDAGTGYGRTLHPAVFEGRDCWLLTPDGRVPLRPE
ncbi:metallophosphoesterase [Chachezhania antarctica]|uniref:metallophosphoesterase n=1 Tax=Chachezhania antarctica TaxID=2340860 RepID=UPI000EB19DBC|nr:metallophosphoesterase [Chachezhania antarctica]|tara:strand:- start:1919 stop:2650 length:732 start_codon:yes stop_codon:yes gene_type:complete